MVPINVRVEHNASYKRQLLESLTNLLPEWFGQPDANLRYARDAEKLPGWIASIDDNDVGLVLVKHHGPASAELYWMGIDPAYHRQGVGSALVKAISNALTREGIRFLFVVTLHPDDPDESYKRTRMFYEKLGFAMALTDPEFVATARNRLVYLVKYLAT